MDESSLLVFFFTTVLFVILFVRASSKLSKAEAQIILLQKKYILLEKEKLKVVEENENLKVELNDKRIENLRFMLNPHSVRNTLNTIHGLANKTYDAVRGLTGIFDYMLYESQQHVVSLKQEVSFAKKYLDLYFFKGSNKDNDRSGNGWIW
jgi:sensor histidine kinase YesM